MFKFLKVAFLKGGSSFGGLLILIVIGYYYDNSELAFFSSDLAIALGISLATRLGWDVLGVKYLPRYFSERDFNGGFNFFITFMCRAFFIFTIICLITFKFLNTYTILLGALFTVSIYFSVLFRSQGNLYQAIFFEPSFSLLITSFALVFFSYFIPYIKPIEVLIISVLVLNVIGGGVVLKSFTELVKKRERGCVVNVKLSDLFYHKGESLTFFIVALNGYFINQGMVWLSGLLGSQSEIAATAVIIKIGVVVSFSLVISNLLYNPVLSVQLSKKNLVEVKNISRKSVFQSSLISCVLFFLILLLNVDIMNYFDLENKKSAFYLLIFCFSQFVNVLTGSAAAILNLSGNEKVVITIQGVCLFLALVLSFILSFSIGGYSPVFSFSITLMLQNVVQVICVKKLLGINIYTRARV